MKKLLLSITLVAYAWGISASIPMTIIGGLTGGAIIGDCIIKGSNCYVAQLATETLNAASNSFESGQAVRVAFKYGIPATLLTTAIKYPNIARFCFNTVKDSAAGACNNIIAGVDYAVVAGRQAWQNKRNIAKVTGVVGALLAANYLARGQDSLVQHVSQHGLPGVVPAIADQYDATAKFIASLFEKQPKHASKVWFRQ